jgi:hypothetical protein
MEHAMQRQPVGGEAVPDTDKRPQRPDSETDQRAEKSPYSREVEDYTDETVKTPKEQRGKTAPS